MPSARPRATATIRTSSSSEPEADDDPFLAATGLARLLVTGGGGLHVRGRLGVGRLGLFERLRVDRVAGHLIVRSGGGLGGRVVQQAALDDLLRAGVPALAHAGALADAAAQVIELGAPHVAAGGHLDLLDLRRMQGKRALDADAEGLLADREGLAHPFALALDHDALEDLRAAPRALDDLEVDLHAIPGLEAGDATQLRALEGVDYGAHGRGTARAGDAYGRRVMVADHHEPGDAPPAAATRARGHDGRRAARPGRSSRATRRAGCSAGTRARPPAPPRRTPRPRTRRRPTRPGACAARCRARPSRRARRRRARNGRSRPPRCRSARGCARRSPRSGRTGASTTPRARARRPARRRAAARPG